MTNYADTYANWQNDPEGFWAEAATGIDWIKTPGVILDAAHAPLMTWFADGVCNTCYNAGDHPGKAGRDAQVAVIHDSPVTDSKTEITCSDRLDRVSRLAGVLAARGIGKGDRVVIYMPMIPDALVAMLACARIGAIHSVVFGGFAAHELAVRIDDATPRAILAASSGIKGKPVGTPDAGTFWRVIADHCVKVLFTAPTALRAIKRDNPDAENVGKYDPSGLKSLFLAGERADPDTIRWAQKHLQIPVIDHWWQTETGWAIAANRLGIGELPVKNGSPAMPMPGYDVDILDEGGHPVAAGELGAIAIKLPLPPGALPTLWSAEDRFRSAYLQTFPGFYETGDAGIKDADGYVYITARTDDVTNVAGHRLSTGAMEEVLSDHPDVAECAVIGIGIGDALKGQQPLGLVCLNKGVDCSEEEIAKECVAMIRQEIGPVAAFKRCIVIDLLPKTRSGKVLRGTMVAIADSRPWNLPATIDDPANVDIIAGRIAGIGETRSENPDIQKEA